jgi:hypothetical protein
MELISQHIIADPDIIQREGIIHEAVGAFKCAYCTRINVGRAFSHEGLAQQPGKTPFSYIVEKDIQWTPKFIEGATFADTPDHIAQAASEAVLCRSSGYLRAAVLMARSVIEATAKDKGITSGSLQDKIDKMHKDALIREHIKEGAHELRYFGNEMAHGDFGNPVIKEDADLVLTLMQEILQEVFASPARVTRAKAARQARSQP